MRGGKLWLIAGAAGSGGEDIPAGLLTDDARLQALGLGPSPRPSLFRQPSGSLAECSHLCSRHC